MTKKQRPFYSLSLTRRTFVKALALASLVALALAFVSLQFPAPPPPLPPSTPSVFLGNPKLSFLFLARSHLPLDFLWHHFFLNADPTSFSIYVHSSPGFVLDASTSRSRFFHGRQIRNSIQVVWGEASMIEAERLLLRTALEDPANQRFVLLSDSCIPLYNFSYIYSYLMSSSKSFVDSFTNAADQRYNPKMSPVILKGKWRKGSQWITLVRKHAEVVVADNTVFPTFKKHCKRRADPDPEKRITLLKQEHNCIPDEHYVQTLFSIAVLEDELERRTLTYTSWNQSVNKMDKQTWHPLTFEYASASPQRIDEIKNINHVYYETEYRTEWCQSNATFVPCFLFARKFSKFAALRLLQDGFLGRYDPSELLSSSESLKSLSH